MKNSPKQRIGPNGGFQTEHLAKLAIGPTQADFPICDASLSACHHDDNIANGKFAQTDDWSKRRVGVGPNRAFAQAEDWSNRGMLRHQPCPKDEIVPVDACLHDNEVKNAEFVQMEDWSQMFVATTG